MFIRGRRLRQNQNIRNLVEETSISVNDLIMPIFLIEGKNKSEKIDSMPEIYRKTLDKQLEDIKSAAKLGINAIIIFPAIKEKLKDPFGKEALNKKGLVPKAIKAIKKAFPKMLIITDVALDPYNSDGHDGILKDGEILNDKTVEILCRQACIHAEFGADIVAPSDMMDGRVVKIREALDRKGFHNTAIMSYAAKFASSLYGPFREALNSEPKSGDKKSYQINPKNYREAIKEILLDEAEGADLLIVKPASFYLDVIRTSSEASVLPIVAYQVSGEYSMIKAAAKNGYIDNDSVMKESLESMKRAGATIIITYFALEMAKLLKK
ncbi:porphobilinogen synthase [bacterium]|mgnify:FL=1|nr:porphobilinogen synthase [bacterium]|tara:strand:- start:1497 stop:2468 length:972 start_codon:yes stop_codon:yes gene_type:complete